jgi:hypothetical protein
VPADTDLVAHYDSDCFFCKPFDASCYFFDGKPRLTKERYSDFSWYAARYSWKANVDHALGGDHEWETMTQHPFIYWIDTYKRMREHVEKRHRYPFDQFVLFQRNEFPQTFAEFPTLGAFALDTDADRYQQIIEIFFPGKDWASPAAGEGWEAFGVRPIEFTEDMKDNVIRHGRQGFSSKALWMYQEGNGWRYEDKGIFNPVIQYWSRGSPDMVPAGAKQSARQTMEELLK